MPLRPYINCQYNDLKKLFDDNFHNLTALQELEKELRTRTKERSVELRRKVMDRIVILKKPPPPPPKKIPNLRSMKIDELEKLFADNAGDNAMFGALEKELKQRSTKRAMNLLNSVKNSIRKIKPNLSVPPKTTLPKSFREERMATIFQLEESFRKNANNYLFLKVLEKDLQSRKTQATMNLLVGVRKRLGEFSPRVDSSKKSSSVPLKTKETVVKPDKNYSKLKSSGKGPESSKDVLESIEKRLRNIEIDFDYKDDLKSYEKPVSPIIPVKEPELATPKPEVNRAPKPELIIPQEPETIIDTTKLITKKPHIYLIDANVFIYAWDGDEQHGDVCRWVLDDASLSKGTTNMIVNEIEVTSDDKSLSDIQIFPVHKINDELIELKPSYLNKEPSEADLSLLQVAIQNQEVKGIVTYDRDFHNIAAAGIVKIMTGRNIDILTSEKLHSKITKANRRNSIK